MMLQSRKINQLFSINLIKINNKFKYYLGLYLLYQFMQTLLKRAKDITQNTNFSIRSHIH